MTDADKPQFIALLKGLSEYYQRETITLVAAQIYFDSLKRYRFDQISSAVTLHVQNTENGQYYPKVADIVRLIDGKEITADELIAAARLKQTPLGILCRIHIGSWDLEYAKDFYLRERAQECLQLLPEWRRRAQAGEYTQHEISIMLKHKVDPAARFHHGLPAPANAEKLRFRARQIEHSPRHLYLVDQSDKPDSQEAELA